MIESENPNVVRDNPKKFKYWITVLYERYINFLDELLILVVIVLSSIILIALYKNNGLIHLFDSTVFDGMFTFIIIFIFIIIIAGLVRSVYHIIVTLAILIILIGSITFACGIWRFDENNYLPLTTKIIYEDAATSRREFVKPKPEQMQENICDTNIEINTKNENDNTIIIVTVPQDSTKIKPDSLKNSK